MPPPLVGMGEAVSRIALDTDPMVWRLTLRTPEDEKPVDLVMSLTSIDDDTWTGEVRFDGYPGPVTSFGVLGCDWIQAHQVMLSDVKMFLNVFAKTGTLYWRGTDIVFDVPLWRRRLKPPLLDRIRARVRARWIALRHRLCG
jgi:hypothetical protein